MYDPTSSQDSLTSSFGDSTFTASGKASADYGVLKTYVDGSLTNYAPQSYYVDCPPNACSVSTYGQPAYADASFTDTFTIGGGAGNGYLVIQMSADGTDSQSGPYSVANGAAAVYDSSSNYYLNTGFHGNTTVHTSAIPFTYNTPLTLPFEAAIQRSRTRHPAFTLRRASCSHHHPPPRPYFVVCNLGPRQRAR